jgi:phage shock protein A
MNIFTKIKLFFKSDDLNLQKSLQQIESQESKLSASLINLIFQNSKFSEKRKAIIVELEDIAIELNQAVREDDEEISVYLLQKTDQLKSEVSFIDTEIEILEKDINEIQATKNDLSLNKEKYKNLLITHSFKLESLRAKKEIKSQISDVNLVSSNTENPLKRIKEKIMRTEAELKVIEKNTHPIEEKLMNNKAQRAQKKYKEQFYQLRASKKYSSEKSKEVVI